MKLSVLTTLAAATLSASDCDAFGTTSRRSSRATVALKASSRPDHSTKETAGVVNRRAAAAMLASTMASLLPVAAQAGDTSLDFALPSYDTKMSGFGEGSEAFVKKGQITKNGLGSDLMIDPGSDEKEKQRAAMQKAEEARKEALAKKKAEQKARDEEAKRRAIEKKARDKERLKNIWKDQPIED